MFRRESGLQSKDYHLLYFYVAFLPDLELLSWMLGT